MIGRIYRLVDHDNDMIYIGSTTKTLDQRLGKHKTDFKRWLKGTGDYRTSFLVLESENYSIELLEECSVESMNDLYKIEGKHQKEANNNCVNHRIMRS
tara:strand:- start:380 stop:673 length:294 start_codon:yes stop_codon:yes gene_type:complete